jgi:hypothetical protein
MASSGPASARVGTKSANSRVSVGFRHEKWHSETLQFKENEPFAGIFLDIE